MIELQQWGNEDTTRAPEKVSNQWAGLKVKWDESGVVMARPRQFWAFSTSPRSSPRLAYIFRACRWSVSVHLKRALTELFRELELTFVQQFGGFFQRLVQAVNLLGNCLLLGKLVILGALLWFEFPMTVRAAKEPRLKHCWCWLQRSCRGTRVAASHGENDDENNYDFPLTSKSREKMKRNKKRVQSEFSFTLLSLLLMF